MQHLFENWRAFLKENVQDQKVSFDFDNTLTNLRGEEDYPPKKSSIEVGPNKEMIERLKSYKQMGNRVFIVTARRETKEDRQDILDFIKHFGIDVNGLFFTNLEPKVHTLTKLGVSIHYDDSPEEIAAIQDSEVKSIQSVHVQQPPEDLPDDKNDAFTMRHTAGLQI